MNICVVTTVSHSVSVEFVRKTLETMKGTLRVEVGSKIACKVIRNYESVAILRCESVGFIDRRVVLTKCTEW